MAVDYSRPFTVNPRTPVPERVKLLEILVRQGATDPKVIDLAQSIQASRPAGEPREVLQFLLDWQHDRAAYVLDALDQEVFQPAWYTVVRGKGDCEDKAVLFSSMARALGYDARVVWLDQVGAQNNHVAAEACMTRDGGQTITYKPAALPAPPRAYAVRVHRPEVPCPQSAWEWVETTIRGSVIGEHPYDALKRLGPPGRSHL